MILQVGSISELVKRLQEFLNIPADGVFGGATQRAVKKWQEENGLIADGVVGPQTWRAMGLATTDSYERYDVGQNVFTYKKNTYQKMNIFKALRKNHGYFYTIQLVGKILSIQ